jgi:hypothetical protein
LIIHVVAYFCFVLNVVLEFQKRIQILFKSLFENAFEKLEIKKEKKISLFSALARRPAAPSSAFGSLHKPLAQLFPGPSKPKQPALPSPFSRAAQWAGPAKAAGSPHPCLSLSLTDD